MHRTAKKWREALAWVLIVLLLTAGGFLLFTRLGVAFISDCDEARHGINAYEMLNSGDYVVSTFQGDTDYWNLKPPLSYYSIILGYKVFGFNALGMRAYSALSMLLVMVALTLWMKRRYGNVAAIACQLFLLGCGLVYGPHFARFGDADAQMLLFYVLAMLFMLDSEKNVRLLYGSAVCFGLAFMSKSWHAALIPVNCLIALCVTGNIRKLKPRNYVLLVVCGLAPILPWAVARYLRDGFTFFEKMFTVDVAKRATTVHEGHFGGWLYYVETLLSDPATALAAAFAAVGLLWRLGARLRVSARAKGVAVWCVAPIVLYTLCVSKLAWYVLVSLPALGMGFGLMCRELANHAQSRSGAWAARLACIVVAFGLMGCWGVQNYQNLPTQNLDRYQRMIAENFDREVDAGTKVYVQYEAENAYGETDYCAWVQDDLLTAMLLGDLECMYGGIDAFLEEEDHAFLICHDVGMDWDALEETVLVAEDGPLMLIENLM